MLTKEQLTELHKNLCSKDKDTKIFAVEKIYEEYGSMLLKRMRYKFRSLSLNDVEDIVQDAFLKIYTTSSLPESPSKLSSWIITITENTSLDMCRRAYKKHELEISEEADSDDGQHISFLDKIDSDEYQNRTVINTDGVITAISEPLNREVEECVHKGLEEFGQKHPEGEAVISMSMDGHPVQEIALLFHRTEVAMRQFIYQCKKKLAPYIAHCKDAIC